MDINKSFNYVNEGILPPYKAVMVRLDRKPSQYFPLSGEITAAMEAAGFAYFREDMQVVIFIGNKDAVVPPHLCYVDVRLEKIRNGFKAIPIDSKWRNNES